MHSVPIRSSLPDQVLVVVGGRLLLLLLLVLLPLRLLGDDLDLDFLDLLAAIVVVL